MKTQLIAIGLGVFVPGAAIGSPAAGGEAPRGSSYAEPYEAGPLPVKTLIDGSATADLAVKHTTPGKPQLKMRPNADPKKKQVAKADSAEATVSTDGDASVSAGYKPFPTSARDLRERVAFRIRAGVELDTAPASGDTLRGGFPLSGGYTDTRPWLAGDAVIGARGIVTPSLNGYFMSSFAFDTSDTLSDDAGTVRPYDAGNGVDNVLAIKAGYVEYGREDRKPDDQQPAFWIRAGRQFRLDGGALFAYFDGATIGYRQKAWSASAFGGQRASLYVDTERGVMFGGTFSLDLKKAANIPGRIYANYTGLDIETTDFDGDGAKDAETRHLINIGAIAKLNKQLKVDASARLTGLPDLENTDAGAIPATKFALGRVAGRAELEKGNAIVIGSVEQRFKDDVAYDLAAPAAVDVVSIADKLGVGLAKPINETVIGVRADWMNKKRSAEVVAFGRVDLPGETPVDVANKGYFEVGAGIAGAPVGVRGSGVYTTIHYKFRQFTNEGNGDVDMNGMTVRADGPCLDLTDADGDGIPDNCQEFGNSASSGVDQMHELAAEAVLNTKASGGRRWRFGAGGFFRVYNVSTPYREVKNDARGGGALTLAWWFNRDFHLDVAGEVAQSSPTFSRDLGVMTSIRAAVEARW